MVRRSKDEGVLTGDGGAGVEGGGDLRVELDHEVALLGHLGVARLDLRLHPRGEGVAEHGVRDVADPLLRQLPGLFPVRVVTVGRGVLVEEVGEPRHRERLVLGHLQVAALVVLEVCTEKRG